MFGSMPLFSAVPPPTEPPKNVPAPTPVRFPRCHPQASEAAPAAQDGQKSIPLTTLLQSVIRPNEIGHKHFEALGVHVQADADIHTLVPDMSVIPDFAKWDEISYEDARRLNESTRNPINNGNKSPGVQTYIDRKRELSIDNNAAYRSVRRIPPPLGQPPTRLGNAYEFYRNLESFSGFWDDTTSPPTPWGQEEEKEEKEASSDGKAAEDTKANGDSSETAEGGGGDSASSASSTAVTDSESKTPAKDSAQPEMRFYRTSSGTMMPPEFRVNMITAFLKLVAYDFGCNVSTPRTEPRLYLNAPTIPAEEVKPSEQKQTSEKQSKQQPAQQPPPSQVQAPEQDLQVQAPKRNLPASYFASGCIFVFRSPQTREAARAGIVEGPLAAVSARHTTTFPDEKGEVSGTNADIDSNIDLARELVAALLTAQHRAREGRAERRFGEGEWWTTKPRWGGGSGGPIGREVDAVPNTDDTAINQTGEGSAPPGSSSGGGSAGGSSRLGGLGGPGGLGGGPGPARSLAGFSPSPSSSSRAAAKKPRKGLAIYDNYRMVRPPSASWDKKTKFMALGRTRGADYDDVFVVSALFHHMSVVRIRVPQALLRALDGDEEARPGGDGKLPSWGRLEVVRSPWFDFFKVEDRLAAMRVVWAMMAFLMRQPEEDVKMSDA